MRIAISLVRLVSLFVVMTITASAFSSLNTSTLFGLRIYLPAGLVAGLASVAAASMLGTDRRGVLPLGVLTLLSILAPVGILPMKSTDPYLLLGGVIAHILLRRTTWSKKNSLFLLAVIFSLWGAQIVGAWPQATAFVASEPTGGGWGTDLMVSMKMFYLMKRGMGYYEAYLTAVALNVGVDPSQVLSASSTVFHGISFLSWRGPFLFYLWMLVPNGITLYGTYLALSSLALACAYLICSRHSTQTGLLAAMIMMPYLTLGLSPWWVEWEFWGSLFSVFAFTLYTRKHRSLAVIPAFFAAACKDLLAGALLGGVVGSMIRRDKREATVWSTGILAYVVYTLWNYVVLRDYLSVTIDVSRWTGRGGPAFIEETFHFAFPWLWSGMASLMIGLAIISILTIRPYELSFYTFASTLLPILTFILIGQKFDEYWGVVYAPFLLLTVVQAASFLHRPTFTTTNTSTRIVEETENE